MRAACIPPILLLTILLPCAAWAACANQRFDPVAHTNSQRDQNLFLPKGLTQPTRGVVATWQGMFVNEGRAQWWIANIDRREVTNVIFRSAKYVDQIPKHGYKVEPHPDGSVTAVRTIALTKGQFTELLCRANALWLYKSPLDKWLTTTERQSAAYERELANWERVNAPFEAAYKRWEHATDKCPKRRDCAGPPPPPGPPMPTERVPPVPHGGDAMFAPATDMYETITLLDKGTSRQFGGVGNLRGAAAELVNWLRSLF